MATGQTVLVVDDERVIRDGCCRLLAREGYRVLQAANGQDALEIVQSRPVSVMVCDLKMPVLDAIGVLEEVKLGYPGIPVIIITGHATVESAVECMKKGAYHFLTKPFRAAELIRITRNAVSCNSTSLQQIWSKQDSRMEHSNPVPGDRTPRMTR